MPPARRRAPLVAAILLVVCTLAGAASAAPVPGACQDGVLPSGALSRICVPASGWNGDLVVWAHGYIAFNEPIAFYHLDLGDVSLPDLVQQLGFAFATTSFRVNGLAVLPAVDDVMELVAAFPATAGRAPGKTYMTGASEGGLITALAIERHPTAFTGGVAACGPIGSFARQVDYVGDFRVLFDYFFPGVLPGSPTEIPAALIDDWDAVYVPAIHAAIAARPDLARELLMTSGAAWDPNEPSTFATTAESVLWYNVFGTNDAVEKVGGNPYDNIGRRYRGSSNDLRLNARVRRVAADPAARAALAPYETSGQLAVPLVTMHTSADQIIPYWHETLYAAKARPTGAGRLIARPVVRYGHCQFETRELIGALATLLRVTR